jgi:hypothetical protein
MISLGFTVAFSVFILAFVDWSKLMNCHDEQSCQNLHHYVSTGHIGFTSLFGFIVMGNFTSHHCSVISKDLCYSKKLTVIMLQHILWRFIA